MQRRSITFAFVVAGFALLDIWCDLLGHSGATVAAAGLVQDAFTNGRVVWNLALVAFCALMVSLPGKLAAVRRVLDVALPVVAVPFTLLYGFAVGPGAAMPVACIVVTGVVYGWLEVRLFCEAAQLPSESSVVAAVVASRVLKAVVAAAIGMLPDGAQVIVDAACALACGACLVLASRLGGSSVFERPATKQLPESDRIAVIVLVAVYPALNAVARALSPLGLWGDASIVGAAGIVPVAAGAVVFAAVCFAIFRKCADSSVFNRMAAALVVLLGALLLANNVALPFVGDLPTSRGVTMGIELFSHSLFWMAGIFAVRMANWPALRLAAATELIMSLLAVALSAMMQAMTGVSQVILSVALYVVMAVLVLVVWRFREELSDQAERTCARGVSAAAAGSSELDGACRRLAAECGLTPRETEVLQLLAEGRSRSYIQEHLVISEATVKTHCTHVYQKLGVSNKQQVIELVRSR